MSERPGRGNRTATCGMSVRRCRLFALAPLVVLVVLVALTTGCGNSPAVRSSSSPTLPASGVVGVVVLYPVCPVESVPAEGGENPCRAVPTEATVRVRDASDALVATVSSGHDGRFRASLRPGTYVLEATAPGSVGCHPIGVTVPPGTYADVTVRCDTGIR
ncbi:carboxypeptidase-like regulatory domain-containing protein [Streptomyces sp. NPDC059909]|uniref:carboxypeptidase-like regulatory domain-containing protein n=1 Tax=Streptomyces sp. NPDC059909 TaxID=3346998 RepID=UPI0036616B79